MPTRTLSASLDADLIDRTRVVAEKERRTQSAVISAALDVYTSMNTIAHQALEDTARRIGMDGVAEHLERAILRLRWELLAEQARDEVRERFEEMSDEEVMALVDEEVREARRARRGGR